MANQAWVEIVPDFRNFQRTVNQELVSGLGTAGDRAGQSAGSSFSSQFAKSADLGEVARKLVSRLTSAVDSANVDVARAARKQADALGELRVAESRLQAVRDNARSTAAQRIAAEELVARRTRGAEDAAQELTRAEENLREKSVQLTHANADLARSADHVGDEFGDAGRTGVNRFRDNLVGGMRGLGGLLVGVVGSLGIGFLIGNAIGDAVRFGMNQIEQSIDVASGLNESINALNVSFGDASAGVQKLGASAAQSMGLSNLEFNNAAVRFSSFAATIAGKGGDVTGVLGDLTGRGADFASVFNLDVGQALELFQSGLAGEAEPLRRFGIDLSAASVNAFAYANGIAKSGAELTASEQVQARYGLLMQQTAKTAGDFANTSGELANSQRILAAEFENAQARLGTMLLPALTQLMSLASTELMPILNQLVDQVGPVLADGLRQSVPAFKELLVAVAPLIPELVKLAVAAIPPLVQIIRLVIPLITDWAQSWSSILTATSAFFGYLAGNKTLQQFQGVLNSSSGTFANWANAVRTAVTAVANGIRQFQTSAVAAFNGFVSSTQANLNRALSAVTGFRTNAVAAFNSFLAGARAVLNNVISAVSAFVSSAVAGFNRFVANVRSTVAAAIGVITALPGRIRGAFAGAGGWLVSAGANIIRGLINGIRSMISSAVSAVVSAGQAIINGAKSALGIRSPSTVFAEIGMYTALGFQKGFDKEAAKIDTAIPVAGVNLSRPSISAGVYGSSAGGFGGGNSVHLSVYNPITEPLTETARRQSQLIGAALAF